MLMEINTQALFNKDLVNLNILMEFFKKVNGKIQKKMDKVKCHGQMEILQKEKFVMVILKIEKLNFLQVQPIKVSGKKVNLKEKVY